MYIQLESYRNSIIMMKSTLTRKILTIVTGLAVTMMGMSSIEAATAATTSSTVSTQVAPGSNQIAAKSSHIRLTRTHYIDRQSIGSNS